MLVAQKTKKEKDKGHGVWTYQCRETNVGLASLLCFISRNN